MNRDITDPVKRRDVIANMMANFGLQMVDLHASELDGHAAQNNTVCLTKDDLITSIENRMANEEKQYGTVNKKQQYYYPEQREMMMTPQPISYPQPQTSDNFDISDYMGIPKQQEHQQSSLEEALKPVIVRLEGICKILGFIYQELKNSQYQPVEFHQEEVATDSKKQGKQKASKKKEKPVEKSEIQSLDDISDEEVAAFDENENEVVEYV